MNKTWINQTKDSVILTVQAVPRAANDSVQGLHGDALKVRLHAPPVDGKANEALLDFLSKKLAVPKRNLTLKSGAGQRRKIIAVSGIALAEIEKRLLS
ncbi:MAG: DUF167 family protein [Kiritimatiellae bacterium]|nr:DUF167 family protein [Kiritimatiellia bacterium]